MTYVEGRSCGLSAKSLSVPFAMGQMIRVTRNYRTAAETKPQVTVSMTSGPRMTHLRCLRDGWPRISFRLKTLLETGKHSAH